MRERERKKSGRRIIRMALCLSLSFFNVILAEKSTEGTIKVFDVRCYGLEEAAFQTLQRTPPEKKLKFQQII